MTLFLFRKKKTCAKRKTMEIVFNVKKLLVKLSFCEAAKHFWSNFY
ncbi:hypothetical protein C5S32_09600 [ANME-1 cluster archaeon GoMg1]|nr:hypothetical protein [ANME-1 cluster archaeon GoMg1]